MALEDREKKMLIVLGAVAGIALAVFLFTTLTGGGGDDTVAPQTQVAAGDPGEEPAEEPAPEEATPPIAGDTAGSVNGPNISARDIFSIPPPPSPSATPTSSPSPGDDFTTGNELTIDTHKIRLDNVLNRATPVVLVNVDGQDYKQKTGSKFASGFMVDSIDGTGLCATFTYSSGETQDTFPLCVQ